MKQCPICGHRTNDETCPVCGAATVTLQNDPQETAQRTIQYQRFDPSKAPGATAGGHTVPTGNRYIQNDPGAAFHQPEAEHQPMASQPAQTSQSAKAAPPAPDTQTVPVPQARTQQAPETQPPVQNAQGHAAPQVPQSASKVPQSAPESSQPVRPKDEFRPSTLPRRSQKYRQKYAAYMPEQPAQNSPEPAPAAQDVILQESPATQPEKGIPTQHTAAVPEEAAAPPTQHTVTVETPESEPEPAGSHGHGLLSPEELEKFLDAVPDAPDDSEASLQAAGQEVPSDAEQIGHPAATPEETIPQDTEDRNLPEEKAPLESSQDTAGAEPLPDAMEQEDSEGTEILQTTEDTEALQVTDSAEIPQAIEDAESSLTDETTETLQNEEETEILQNEDMEPVQTAGETETLPVDELPEDLQASESLQKTEIPEPSPDDTETTEDSEENPPLTREELIRQRNAQRRRENNRRYAEEHASRATRRWQEESEEEPFDIVRGTCYYSALESETTVRGNFSKKRYKDDVLPQQEPVSYEDSEWYQGFDTADDPWGDYEEPDEKKPGISHKAWFIILLLILIWPIGLILMWVRKKFPLAVRIIITLLLTAILAGEGFFLHQYGAELYDQIVYGDNQNITYEVPDSSDGTQNTSQDASATDTQKTAITKAEEYLDTLPLSQEGLIKQLEYDGISKEDATYAASHCDANWNKEAEEMAKQYLDSSAYNKKAMIQQLEADGFTKAQAEFGAKAAGLK